MSAMETRKTPFGHPVPAEAIDCFCHPRAGHKFHRPAWGRDSKLYASCGWVTVRFFNFPAAFGEAPQTMVDELQKLPWHLLKAEEQATSALAVKDGWRCLDDVRGEIYRERLFAPWKDSRGGYRTDPAARINHGLLVPLVALQLVARLPRPEIYVNAGRGVPVPFRFNGGEGLLWTLSHEQEAAMSGEACHIFGKREDRY